MSDVVIKAEGLGKKYLIGHQSERERYTALRDVLARNVKSVLHKTRQVLSGQQLLAGDEVEEFWALRDIDFEIKRGDRVGIIGRNGAGKSTLLKILSRITEPSAGRVEIRGRVASLLEVGTGFHPELTGRENIYLNGAILGMTRAEIKKKFDEIVDFAGVEKFLDTPVKRYSSGMYVRLAFAVAAHLEPEILVVDEVLAVGDAEFQKKCLGKMEEVSKNEGRTVLFVSHNMSIISQLCSNSIYLKSGKIISFDTSINCIDLYNKESNTESRMYGGNRYFVVNELCIQDDITKTSTVSVGNNIKLSAKILFRYSRSIDDFSFRIKILSFNDKKEFYCYDSWKHNNILSVENGDNIQIEVIISSIPLCNDDFEIIFWGHSYNSDIWEELFSRKIEIIENQSGNWSDIDKNTTLQLQTYSNLST